MSAKIIDGKEVAASLRQSISKEIATFESQFGTPPGLAVVLVGNNPASKVYVKMKQRACAEVGMYSEKHELPADIDQDSLMNLVQELNQRDEIHGILVQLPLPSHLDERAVIQAVAPHKDVDGFHPHNTGLLLSGVVEGLLPCTPAGVMELLKACPEPLSGKHAVVVGRSEIVGKPTALLLLHENATVTIAHSKTRDLAALCRQADILVAAVGRPKLIQRDAVKPGAIVIDVGINRLPEGELVGDVDFEAVKEVASYITPVPGGVGPMTIAMLLKNTLQAAKSHMESKLSA